MEWKTELNEKFDNIFQNPEYNLINEYTVKELKEFCEDQKLSKTGKKDSLIKKILKHCGGKKLDKPIKKTTKRKSIDPQLRKKTMGNVYRPKKLTENVIVVGKIQLPPLLIVIHFMQVILYQDIMVDQIQLIIYCPFAETVICKWGLKTGILISIDMTIYHLEDVVKILQYLDM